MPTFNFSVENKIVSHVGTNPHYVHGNTDYEVVVSFDEEWAGLVTFTARIRWVNHGLLEYRDIVFTGDSFNLPALYDMDYLEIGFFAGNKHTTTPAIIICDHSILDYDPTIDIPDPDVYAQILDLIQEGAVHGMSPYIGTNLHWYTWDDDQRAFVDTGITARGEVTIHAPYIGGNGNWYQFDASTETYIDTEVHAEGPQGTQGPKGDPGSPGVYTTYGSGLADVADGVDMMVSWSVLVPEPSTANPPTVGAIILFTQNSTVGKIVSVSAASRLVSVEYMSSYKGETGEQGIKGHPGIYTNSDIEMVEDLTLMDVAWSKLSPSPTVADPPIVGDPVFFISTSAIGIITAVRPTTASGPKFDVTYQSSLIGEDYILTDEDKQDIADIVKDDITIPTQLSELTDDSTHRVVTDAEKTAWDSKQGTIADLATIRSGAALGSTALQSVPSTYRLSSAQDAIDAGLSSRIDAIAAQSDVKDVVGTHAELLTYSTSSLTIGDVIKVLVDETKSDAECYWRFSSGNTWTFVGESADTYSKTSADALLDDKIDMAKERVYLEGTYSAQWMRGEGSLWGTDKTYGYHLEVPVVSGKTYYASGSRYSVNVPLGVIFDENDTVLGTFGPGNSAYEAVNDISFTTPAGSAKVVVNARRNSGGKNHPSVYSIDNAEQTGNSIDAGLKGKQSKVITWRSVGTSVMNKFIGTNVSSYKIAVQDRSGWNYVWVPYDRTKRYRVTGTSTENGSPALLVCADADGNPVSKMFDGNGPIIRKEYTIPPDTEYLYVNASSYATSNFRAKIEVAEERDITSFEAGKIGVFFGDSITSGNGVQIQPTVTPYLDYPTVVGELLNCTTYNGGIGGAGWRGSRGIDAKNVINCVVSGNFSTVIQSIQDLGLDEEQILQYNKIAALDFNSVDFVCFAYGTNDWTGGAAAENVKAAMAYCFETLLTAYPKLKIYVLTPIYRYKLGTDESYDSDTYTRSDSGLKLYDICEAIIEASRAAHVPCKDMYYESGFSQHNRAAYFKDGTHLNADGYAVFAEKVAKFIDSN